MNVEYQGPGPEAGALPGFFYFALSAKESLETDPYNQPAAALKGKPIRCYSVTLPFHGEGFDNQTAMERWAEDLEAGAPKLRACLDEIDALIGSLIDEGWLLGEKIAVAGLSRGGWIATHVAARNPKIKALVGYAPLARISQLTEAGRPLDLISLCDQLTETHVRFYIGNRDVRVGTERTFEFITALAESGYKSGHRSPRAELIVTPSIGHKGHGTPMESFYGGAKWALEQL